MAKTQTTGTEPRLSQDGVSTRGTFTESLSNAVPQSRWKATQYSKSGANGKAMVK